MDTRLEFEILRQPDDYTCGPTCLHSVYRYFGDDLPQEQVIAETAKLEDGGTLGALLGCHALRRGYEATLYTYNLQVFDPTWFEPTPQPLAEKLRAQQAAKQSSRLHVATEAYVDYLQLGGQIYMEDLTPALIRRYLKRGIPILTGLSATYLYRAAREFGSNFDPDDVRGHPAGHFVVLCGYDKESRSILIADPLATNPYSGAHKYEVEVDRVICAILLGILTYDANLLILEQTKKLKR